MSDSTKGDDGRLAFKEVLIGLIAAATFVFLIVFYFRLTVLPPVELRDAKGEVSSQLREWSQGRVDNTRRVVEGLFTVLTTFIGYYVGRIPSEKAANTAQDIAQQKTAEALGAKEETKAAQKVAEQKTGEAAAARNDASTARGEAVHLGEVRQQAVALLEAASARLKGGVAAGEDLAPRGDLSAQIDQFLASVKEG